MRTAFFVEGYNLYYGALHGSPYKWLDLPAILSRILLAQNPACETASVHYYTSHWQHAARHPMTLKAAIFGPCKQKGSLSHSAIIALPEGSPPGSSKDKKRHALTKWLSGSLRKKRPM